MKRQPLTTHYVCSALVLLLLCCAGVLPAYSAQPKTVRDYFLLLPQDYFEIPPEQRKAWLSHYGNIVDIQHGYIAFVGDSAQATMYVALFTYHGQVTVAVYYTAVDGSLDFLRYVKGHWKKVTKEVMPVAFHGDYVYELPRYGTKIRVTANKFNEETQERASKVGKKVYDLIWTHGKFVVKR